VCTTEKFDRDYSFRWKRGLKDWMGTVKKKRKRGEFIPIRQKKKGYFVIRTDATC